MPVAQLVALDHWSHRNPLHMLAADLAPLQSQQTSQHARTGEGELQVQPIQMPHDGEVGGRHWSRQIINAAAADLQNFGLLGDRQIVSTVDHRFALSNPALVSAPSPRSCTKASTASIVGVATLTSRPISWTAVTRASISRDRPRSRSCNIEILWPTTEPAAFGRRSIICSGI